MAPHNTSPLATSPRPLLTPAADSLALGHITPLPSHPCRPSSHDAAAHTALVRRSPTPLALGPVSLLPSSPPRPTSGVVTLVPPAPSYRYKIYIEGSTWSVSQKHILACDSTTLLVTPKYYDLFSMSLMPIQHYYLDIVELSKFSIEKWNPYLRARHKASFQM
ncbi:hypothetical protein GUJ93_ZPchr0010g10274 [Zizania palustris]|uniref:Glycosyl transferase CAP10 domain-containing protein n=1 Tax=Zizania palustris TaxID=103762 RepID=A0A8J6BIR5_ZIZPA|nr:hypothetical protein GUJ93_ZPchr0010g10274 [Zizania palustris]